VLIPTVLAVLGIITGVGALIRGCAEPPPDLSVIYIVDRSARMGGKIGGEAKFPAVRQEILEQVRDRPDVATALRVTGGEGCTQGYRPPTVDYARDNADAFEDALDGVKPGGRSDFAHALAQAANDLVSNDVAAESKSRTIFVAVAGADSCAGDQTVTVIDRALRDLRAEKEVDMTFKFVGIKPSRRMKRLLKKVEGRVDDLGFHGETVIADTPEELADAIPDTPSPDEEEYEEDEG
jgi:hypothetical protein